MTSRGQRPTGYHARPWLRPSFFFLEVQFWALVAPAATLLGAAPGAHRISHLHVYRSLPFLRMGSMERWGWGPEVEGVVWEGCRELAESTHGRKALQLLRHGLNG